MRLEKFSQVFSDVTSFYQKIRKEDYLQFGEFPIIDQGQQFVGGFTNDSDVIQSNNLPVIVFGDHTRIFKFIDFPFTIGADGVKVLELKNKENHAKYSYYYLKQLKLINKGYSRHFKFLKESKIPLPPLQDQIRIATILEKAETLIRQRKESLQLLDKLLRDTFLSMFGDPVRNEMGWEQKKLIEISTKITDGTHHSPPVLDQGIPYITAKHIKENNIDFKSSPWYISPDDHKKIYSRCDPKKGDVLYIKDGATTGVAAKNDFDFEFSMLSSVALIRPDLSQCVSEFLVAWLNSPVVKSRLIRGMSGGAIQRFTLKKIKDFEVICPPINQQKEFAYIVEKVEALKSTYKASLTELDNLYGSLSQRAFKEGGLDLSGVEIEAAELEIEKVVKDKKGVSPFYGGGFPVPSKTSRFGNDPAPLSGDPALDPENIGQERYIKPKEEFEVSISKESLPKQSKWELYHLSARPGQKIKFDETDGDTILRNVFSKKNEGFTFSEFEKFLKKESFSYEYDELKDFFFNKLESKDLVQFYASEEWMRTNQNKPITKKHDFMGKSEIRFVTTIKQK